MTYRPGDWFIHCDVCGKRCYASETIKLSQYTGKGGLIVCRRDADRIDQGLIPFTPRRETNVTQIRINHTDTTDSSAYFDIEEMSYMYFLSSSQDNIILSPSQNLDEGLTVK